MERTPQGRDKKKNRTGAWISFVLHVLIIGLIAYLVSKTELGKQITQNLLQGVRKKETEEKPKPPPAQKLDKGSLKPPPGAPAPTQRRADAPAATTESFFGKSETKETGPRQAATTNAPVVVQAPVIRPPPKIFASAPPRSDIKQLLAERAKAAASVEAIGSEQISKAGVSDAGAVVTKIAGATLADGKFAVIRGLSERYVSTTLNGANLPSADPYRQSAPLDLFPAQVIDKVVVTKTFTPDQPGNSTGGGIDVITKSFPERQFLSVSLGGEYNTQASLNDKFLTYEGGGTDWAAIDDGKRALPPELEKIPPGQQLPDRPITSGVIGTDVYLQNISNAMVLDKVSRALGTTEFAPHHEAPPLNHNMALAGGGTTYLFGRPLGYFASGSYKHDYSFYEDGVQSRYQSGTQLKSTYRDTRALSVVNWSAMVNMAYQPLDDQELGFTFFYNQNGIDDARIQDEGKEVNQTLPGPYRKLNLYYTERNLNTYQFKGDHRFPEVGGLQFNWMVALTETTQEEPDARFFNDAQSGGEYTTEVPLPAPSNPTRYFRNLDENNTNIKLDWMLPFRNWQEDEGQFKFGLFDSSSDRSFDERAYYYDQDITIPYKDDPNLFLNASNLGLVSVTTNFFRGQPRSYTFHWGSFVRNFAPSLYNGDRDIQAGYLMLDLPVNRKLRLVGGARFEKTDLSVHSESYLNSSVTSLKTNDTKLDQSDLLPSAGLIYAVTPKMNVRLNYSETIARPSFRELAAYYSYDTIINDFVEGNPLLEMTSIKNYDFRWEWFPRPGELLSVSLFYKDIKNAIERGNIKSDGEVITFLNNDAKLYGIEFEGRKTLDFLDASLKYFSFGANLSLLESEVKLSERDLQVKRDNLPDADDTRPLYDQSPYILNLDFTYSNPFSGTTAGLIFNVAGPRIVITKLNTDDVYDQPAPVMDFIFSQRIGRHLSVKFTAKNLLDPEIERTYGKDGDLIYSSYRRGRAFGFGLTYDF